MLIRFFKQISAPAVFSKAVLQYKQKEYAIAMQLLAKAGKWMPTLQENVLFQAINLLCNYHLSQNKEADQLRSTLNALTTSPHHDTDDYISATQDIQQIIDKL